MDGLVRFPESSGTSPTRLFAFAAPTANLQTLRVSESVIPLLAGPLSVCIERVTDARTIGQVLGLKSREPSAGR